jgi:hypothetical protein
MSQPLWSKSQHRTGQSIEREQQSCRNSNPQMDLIQEFSQHLLLLFSTKYDNYFD